MKCPKPLFTCVGSLFSIYIFFRIFPFIFCSFLCSFLFRRRLPLHHLVPHPDVLDAAVEFEANLGAAFAAVEADDLTGEAGVEILIQLDPVAHLDCLHDADGTLHVVDYLGEAAVRAGEFVAVLPLTQEADHAGKPANVSELRKRLAGVQEQVARQVAVNALFLSALHPAALDDLRTDALHLSDALLRGISMYIHDQLCDLFRLLCLAEQTVHMHEFSPRSSIRGLRRRSPDVSAAQPSLKKA